MSMMSSGTLPLELSSFYFPNLMGHVVEIGYVRSFLVTSGTLEQSGRPIFYICCMNFRHLKIPRLHVIQC